LVPINVGVGPINIVTAGSITYADFQWVRGGCDVVASTGPVIRNGNNFSYNFELEMEYGEPCPQWAMIETTTVALGTLAPGNYTFTIDSWSLPIATNHFTVSTNSGPTLLPIGFAGDGSFQIHLNGVGNVSYVLQCSTNLADWKTLSTNTIGAPLRDPSPGLPGFRYYRVQVLQP
jgi:hypothetical protein